MADLGAAIPAETKYTISIFINRELQVAVTNPLDGTWTMKVIIFSAINYCQEAVGLMWHCTHRGCLIKYLLEGIELG